MLCFWYYVRHYFYIADGPEGVTRQFAGLTFKQANQNPLGFCEGR
jgi:hypothetical protein